MSKEDDFNYAWTVMIKNIEFVKLCERRQLEEIEQKFIVATAMDHGMRDTEKCKIIGLKYNFRPHQKYKVDHEDGEYDEIIFLTIRALAEKKMRPDNKNMTDIERLEEIESGNYRVTDRLKAMELKLKLVEKRQGSQILKPWQRIWCDVIIPNMLKPSDTNTL